MRSHGMNQRRMAEMLINMIDDLMLNYHKRTGELPTRIYVGRNELKALVIFAERTGGSLNSQMADGRAWRGITVIEVKEDNHLFVTGGEI